MGPGLCSGPCIWFTMKVRATLQNVTERNHPDEKAYYEAARALNERIFQAKARERKRLAALNFTEKIRILVELRDRSLVFAEARQKRKGSAKAPSVARSGGQQ